MFTTTFHNRYPSILCVEQTNDMAARVKKGLVDALIGIYGVNNSLGHCNVHVVCIEFGCVRRAGKTANGCVHLLVLVVVFQFLLALRMAHSGRDWRQAHPFQSQTLQTEEAANCHL